MDNVDSVWQISIISLFAGVLIGALTYRLFSPSVKRIDEVESDLSKARDEMSSYKTSVNQHFNKTSELVNDLTQNYVKVYQHLADGAQSLGDIGTLNNLLEQSQGKVSIAVSEEIKDEDSLVDVSPIETTLIKEPLQAVDETVAASPDMEPEVVEPKDFADTVIMDTSETVVEAHSPVESSEPAPDLDSSDAEAKANTEGDTAEKQNSEDADANVAEENEPETKETDTQATKKT
jgi:uncharacterized membrane-anchored protein YhcB (DUF1043 family)